MIEKEIDSCFLSVKLNRALRDARLSSRYFETHWQQLLEQYNNKFVAVLKAKREVVASSDDLINILDLIQKDYRIQDVWVRFVTDDPRKLTGH